MDPEETCRRIEAEFAIAMGSPERVAAACASLGEAAESGAVGADLWIRLLPLLQRRGGALARPLFDRLRSVALASPDPWPLLRGLLAARDPDLAFSLLPDLARAAAEGGLPVDRALALGLASRFETGESAPVPPERWVGPVRAILERFASEAPHPGDEPLVDLLLHDSDLRLRRLAARSLDDRGAPIPPKRAERIVGPEAFRFLAPYFAYTRASHLDLLDLAPNGAVPPAVLESFREAEARCGDRLLGAAIAELGWSRVNLGLEVQEEVEIPVGETFPFRVRPSEAFLLEDPDGAATAAAGRRTRSFLLIAHGGGGAAGDGGGGATAAAGGGVATAAATAAAESGGAAAAATSADGGGTAKKGSEDRIALFRRYNLAHATALAEILSLSPLTGERARRLVGACDRIVGDFTVLFSEHDPEARRLPELYGTMRERIVGGLEHAAPDAPLGGDLTRLVTMFEDPRALDQVRTLHGLKRYLHQKGLRLGFRLMDAAQGTNRTVDLVHASPERILHLARPIEYVEYEPLDRRDGEPLDLPLSVRLLVEACARHLTAGSGPLPDVKVFGYGNEVHYYVSFGSHPALLRIDWSPPSRGGMIDLEYYGVSKNELESHPAPQLPAIRTLFERLDFDCAVASTRVHARYDKERAATLGDLRMRASLLFRMLPLLMDLDWTISATTHSAEEKLSVADAWSRFFLLWGTIPYERFLTRDRRAVLSGWRVGPDGNREVPWSGAGACPIPFASPSGRRLVSRLDARLREAGLRDLVPDLEAIARDPGQEALERACLAPLRDAVLRGEAIAGLDRISRTPASRFRREHETERFARLLLCAGTERWKSYERARLLAGIFPGLRVETTGSVNGYETIAATVELPGTRPRIYLLLDRDRVPRFALVAREGLLFSRRQGERDPWKANASEDPEKITAELRRYGFPVGGRDAPAPGEDAAIAAEMLERAGPAPPAESTPGARLLAGTIVSGGRAAGLARFGTTGRKPADLDGAILVSATLRPEDNTFLYRASGIVSTGGAILSHAGLLALQFRKPALLVPGEPRLDSGGSWSLPFERFEEEETVSEVRGVPIRARSRRSLGQDRLREGDLLVLDAESGTLEVLGQDPDALALRAALSTLADCERRLGSAADEAELLEIRGRRLRARHQLGRLLDRIEDPRLAVFAIDEIGRIAPEDAALASSRGALLRNLLANPRVGAAAGQRIAAVARERTGRRERLLAETEAAVASSGDPLEILMLRRRLLEVFKSAREAEALRDAAFDEVGCAAASEPARASSPSSAPGGFHSPGRVEGLERREGFERRESLESLDRLDRLDRLAGRRLRILRDRLAEELAASGCLDLANGEQLARARGRLEALSLLDSLLPAGARRVEIRRSRDARANAIREAIEARDCERAALLGEKIVLDPMDGGYEMLPWIGSKAANLTRVAHLLGPRPVPPWFAVTDFALRWTMAAPLGDGQAGTLREAIDGILADPDTTDAQKSWMIGKLWEAASIPEPVAAAIVEAYRRLGGPGCPDRDTGMPFVAVRSSGLEEDTSAATRAGEFETFLMVRGERELLSHVRRAWSGFWTERAIHNRALFGRPTGGAAGSCAAAAAAGAPACMPGRREGGGGILVQRIAWSRVSGVLQTVNAAEGKMREMVVNVCLGLGEGIVSGQVGSDRIFIEKDAEPAGATSQPAAAPELRFRYVIGDKQDKVVFDEQRGSGTIRVATRYHERFRAALEYPELLDLVRAARALEDGYGIPLDIEFGFEGADLRILQARPVASVLLALADSCSRDPLPAELDDDRAEEGDAPQNSAAGRKEDG